MSWLLPQIREHTPLESIDYTIDAEVALEAFRQACRGARETGMELVGDFTYIGKIHEVTIRVRKIEGKR